MNASNSKSGFKPDPTQILQIWLQNLSEVVAPTNEPNIGVERFADLFSVSPPGWLRDNLIFTWDHRSLEGRDAIVEFLSESSQVQIVNGLGHDDDDELEAHDQANDKPQRGENRLSKAKISNVELKPLYGIVPQITPHGLIEGTFTFETPIFFGKGYVLLTPASARAHAHDQQSVNRNGNEDDQLEPEAFWKAFSLYVSATDLKGHEESGTPIGYYANHAKTWQQVLEEDKRRVEEDPHVVILGAAHNGLNVGARFRQMRIPTLLLDKCDRVGDVWRNRYPSLTLHTPNPHHAMLYTRPPSNWPKFTPRDKIVHMLEQYAINQELVIWTRSTILPNPVYDPSTKRWTIHVLKDDEKVTLRPYHIVLATGLFGPRYIPDLPGSDLFKGTQCHAEEFKGPEDYKDKHVVVVGAAQTASDICLDLVLNSNDDAGSITMVQRSSTLVTSIELTNRNLDVLYPVGGDPNTGDLRSSGLPVGLLKKLAIAAKDARVAEQKEMLDGLVKAGLKVNEGEEGGGFPVQLYATGNRIDIGAAHYVINGRIKIKSGEPARFTETGIIFKDGTFLKADAVIFGTGYYPVQESLIPVFGKEISERICPAWGMDKEGEMIRNFRPCGHPGLWWATGGFNTSRYYSKSLAIQIKARELGLVEDEDCSNARAFK